jgi:hypothetical protein
MRDRQQRITERAFAIWEREGRPNGRAEDHWLQAEKEIDREKAVGTTSAKAGSRKPTTAASKTPAKAAKKTAPRKGTRKPNKGA